MMDEMKELEILKKNLEEYNECAKRKRKKRNVFIAAFLLVCVPLYLYLRLFNTKFEWNEADKRLDVKYSTAWYIRYPAEYEGHSCWSAGSDYEYFGTRAPHVLYIYFEDGIEFIHNFQSDTLLGVRIPDTVWFIGYGAFCGNNRMVHISFPEKMQNDLIIFDEAFRGAALREVVLPEGTSEIGSLAFNGCKWLKRVEIPGSLEKVNATWFANCNRLETIKLNEGVECIKGSFYGCEKLRDIQFSSTFKYATRLAFDHSGLWDVPLSTLQFPEGAYYASNGTGHLLDYDLQNKHVSELTGISLDVLKEASDSEKVWIEGVWYQFPMGYDEFMQQDSWELVTENEMKDKTHYDKVYTMKLAPTEMIMEFYLKDSEIVGCVAPGRGHNVVMPGGYVCGVSRAYRAFYEHGSDVLSIISMDRTSYYIGDDYKYCVTVEWKSSYDETVSYVDFYYDENLVVE